MGNQLLKNYVVDESQYAEGGIYLKWRCVSGYHRERHHETVTLFVFEKKTLEGLKHRYEHDLILETLRRDATNLQKLRHPCVLPLLEPFVEDKLSLAFATKRVTQTVSGYLTSLMRRPEESNTSFPLEAKSGFFDICEALAFLHYDAKLAHLNLTPSSIFLSPQCRWYLGCLGYARAMDAENDVKHRGVPCLFEFNRSLSVSDTVPCVDPWLAYCAPEMTSPSPSCSIASDIFSLGLILVQIIKPDKTPLIHVSGNGDVAGHQRQCSQLAARLRELPCSNELYALASRMLNVDPASRPSILDVLASPFFNDVEMKALRFLESIQEKTEAQQLQFLTAFPNLLKQPSGEFANNVDLLRCRVVPPLLNFLRSPALVTPLLTVLFALFPKVIDPFFFRETFWPKFRPLLTAREIPSDAVILIVNNFESFIKLSENDIIEGDLLPFVIKCLKIQAAVLQCKILDALLATARHFQYVALSGSILPSVLGLLTNPSTSSIVRVKALNLVSGIAKMFDRNTINEHIVTTIAKVIRLDRNATVIVTSARTLASLMDIVGPPLAYLRILPILASLPGDENLNAEQFEVVFGLLQGQLTTLVERRRKEFQLHSEVNASLSLEFNSSVESAAFERYEPRHSPSVKERRDTTPKTQAAGRVISQPKGGIEFLEDFLADIPVYSNSSIRNTEIKGTTLVSVSKTLVSPHVPSRITAGCSSHSSLEQLSSQTAFADASLGTLQRPLNVSLASADGLETQQKSVFAALDAKRDPFAELVQDGTRQTPDVSSSDNRPFHPPLVASSQYALHFSQAPTQSDTSVVSNNHSMSPRGQSKGYLTTSAYSSATRTNSSALGNSDPFRHLSPFS